MLWRVEGSQLFLCATAHLLQEQDSIFNPELRAAYQSSQRVAFESGGDVGEMPGDVKLSTLPQLHAEASAIAQSIGLDPSHFGTMPLWRVAFMILGELARRRGLSGDFGVDARLKSAARVDGKQVAYLEPAPAAPACFSTGGLERQVARFRHFLSRIPEVEAEMCAVIQAWRERNLYELERLYRKRMEHDPELGRCLIEGRNRAWLPTIVAMIRDQTPTLVCAGALHFVADVGLPRLLAEQGYVIEPTF